MQRPCHHALLLLLLLLLLLDVSATAHAASVSWSLDAGATFTPVGHIDIHDSAEASSVGGAFQRSPISAAQLSDLQRCVQDDG
jgi:hypothetical protein